jgi:hypothetical protein
VADNSVLDAKPEQDGSVDHQTQFISGTKTFTLLFTRWMDTNGWSHPTMVSLAKACLHGTSWLHSSQISGLRHARLLSPGPRTFIAIERLNYYVHRYSTTKALLPGTPSSNQYAEAFAITENGKPPELGWWVEVFCGQRVPTDIDLRTTFFTEAKASELSRSWGALVRRLMTQEGIDLITELDKTLRDFYPARDAERLEKTLEVIQNRGTWSADELSMELPALCALTGRLGGPTTEEALLQTLKGA